ncbi:MAG: hypothetical protein ACLR3T_00095 [Alistipes finegoldii]
MQYIDWKNPRNNVFHVTEEFAVSHGDDQTAGPTSSFRERHSARVIECKRPDEGPIEWPFRSTSATRSRRIRSLYLY